MTPQVPWRVPCDSSLSRAGEFVNLSKSHDHKVMVPPINEEECSMDSSPEVVCAVQI